MWERVMETLFRLLLARPAVAQDPQNPSIELTQESPYQNAVRNAVQTGAGRAAIEEISRAFVASDRFIPEPSANPLGDRLADLADRLDRLEADRSATSGKVAEAIQAAFDRPAAEVADSEEFLDMRSRLRDSLLAIKILQEEHHRPIEELTRQLRTAEVIGRAATDEHFPQGEEQLRSWRRRSLRLPVEPALKSRLSTREAEEQLRQRRQEAQQQRENEVNGLLASHEQLRIALFELGALGGEHFRVSDRPGGAASPPPETVRLTAEATRASDYLSEARALHLRQLERSVEGGGGPGVNAQAAGLSEGATASAAASLAQTLIPAVSPVLPGRVTFEPPDLADVGFILQVSAADRLSESTRALLAERSLDLASMPLDRLTHTLESDLAGTVSRLEAVAGHPVKQSLLRIGDAMLTIQTPITAGWGTLGTGGLIPLPTFPLDGRVPHTKGDTAPAGVADLLVVKQQLTGYEAADIAHIENVLKGESKTREHSRRQETELVTTSEREVTTSEERELETTDRFEMTRETSQTIKEDLSLKAGLNVSGKYGPTVEFAASAEGSFSRSKEEATKAATTFSQDVTERSSRKIAERVLERTTLRVTTETIEKNTHELNNTTGQGHISGVYQWVNKVYQAQIFNYGLRALFDFMIPEPATFLIAAMSQAHTSALSLTKPPDFPLTPSQINESNYSYWVKQCGATDVAPPPELYRTKSMDFKAGGGDKNTNYNHSGQITIDDGYRALFGSVGFVRNVWESDHSLDVTLGRRTQRMGDGNWLWTTTLDDERDSIPVALDFLHCSQVAVAVGSSANVPIVLWRSGGWRRMPSSPPPTKRWLRTTKANWRPCSSRQVSLSVDATQRRIWRASATN